MGNRKHRWLIDYANRVPREHRIPLLGRALWQVKPFIVFFPAAFLSVTVLAVNLVGDGLRDALDPRMKIQQ